jgi:hypothetical protein
MMMPTHLGWLCVRGVCECMRVYGCMCGGAAALQFKPPRAAPRTTASAVHSESHSPNKVGECTDVTMDNCTTTHNHALPPLH